MTPLPLLNLLISLAFHNNWSRIHRTFCNDYSFLWSTLVVAQIYNLIVVGSTGTGTGTGTATILDNLCRIHFELATTLMTDYYDGTCHRRDDRLLIFHGFFPLYSVADTARQIGDAFDADIMVARAAEKYYRFCCLSCSSAV
jgi:hypothetical protein